MSGTEPSALRAAASPGGGNGTGMLALGGGVSVLLLLTLAAAGPLPAGARVLALLAGLGSLGAVVLLYRRLAALGRAAAALQAELADADARRRAAEAGNAAKSLFLAEMSHELRTPLNTVIGFSEMMSEEMLGPHGVPAYGDYAADILASGRHLLALADDLLDLARIESGHRVLLETPVDLDRLGRDSIAMLAPQARGRGVRLVSDVPAPGARLWGDERAVKQMVLNLLANAVKFTPDGGEVRFWAGRDAAGAPLLRVEDTGPGVSEAELPLDDARHRESRVDPASGRGAGLGLAIVRALAGLHGAELRLVPAPEGGTRAEIAFPAARAMAAPEPPASAA